MFRVETKVRLRGSQANVTPPPPPPTIVEHRALSPFSFLRFADNLGYERRRRQQIWDRDNSARHAMWTSSSSRPLAEPPVLYLDDIMRDISSERRYRNLWDHDPGRVSRMKDLVAEGRVLGGYDDWAIEMSNDDPDSARREFYYWLREDLSIEGDAVREEFQELSNTAKPLGLFELLYLDNDGGTRRIKALWEAGEVVGYEDDPAVQAEYGHVFDEYAVSRFERWQLDMDGGTKELQRCLRAGEYVAGWTHPRVQEKYGYLALSDAI